MDKKKSVFESGDFEIPETFGGLSEDEPSIGEAEKQFQKLKTEILDFGKEITALTDSLGDMTITTLSSFIQQRESKAIPFAPNLTFALLQIAARMRGTARGLYTGPEETWKKLEAPFDKVEKQERKFVEDKFAEGKDSEDFGESS